MFSTRVMRAHNSSNFCYTRGLGRQRYHVSLYGYGMPLLLKGWGLYLDNKYYWIHWWVYFGNDFLPIWLTKCLCIFICYSSSQSYVVIWTSLPAGEPRPANVSDSASWVLGDPRTFLQQLSSCWTSPAESGCVPDSENNENMSLGAGGMQPASAGLIQPLDNCCTNKLAKGWDVSRLIQGLSHLHPTFSQATT